MSIHSNPPALPNLSVCPQYRGKIKPVGVAEYTLTRELPAELVDKLPKPEELEKQILQELGNGESDTM